MAKDKTFVSDKVMTFLGYELDSEMMDTRIPIDKVKKMLGHDRGALSKQTYYT